MSTYVYFHRQFKSISSSQILFLVSFSVFLDPLLSQPVPPPSYIHFSGKVPFVHHCLWLFAFFYFWLFTHPHINFIFHPYPSLKKCYPYSLRPYTPTLTQTHTHISVSHALMCQRVSHPSSKRGPSDAPSMSSTLSIGPCLIEKSCGGRNVGEMSVWS